MGKPVACERGALDKCARAAVLAAVVGQPGPGGRSGKRSVAEPLRALCAAVLKGGFDLFLSHLGLSSSSAARPDSLHALDQVFKVLQLRAEQYYRREVWPLRHAFGVLSRFVNGVTDGAGQTLTPMVVTTWLSDGGYVCCSCSGRTAHVGRQAALLGRRRDPLVRTAAPPLRAVRADQGVTPAGGPDEARRAAGARGSDDGARCDDDDGDAQDVDPVGDDGGRHRHGLSARAGEQATEPFRAADANCVHARFFAQSLDWLSSQLGVPVSKFRWSVPRIYSRASEAAMVKRPAGGVAQEAGEDWDAEGPIEVFRTARSAVAVVVSGVGLCKVVAPVRCTRHVTSCAFCDSAAGFSCVHAVRSRSIRRDQVAGTRASRTSGSEGHDDGVDGARSSLPIPPYNCLRAVRAEADVCAMVRKGQPFVMQEPSCCPECKTARPASVEATSGS